MRSQPLTLRMGVITLLLCGACAPQKPTASSQRQSVAEAMSADADSGFARALSPRPFVFPQDDGPHPDFQTEWWYYTGNLQDARDPQRKYGYQLTIFRRALAAEMPERSSDWASRQVYFAHFAFSDIPRQRFFASQRISRGAAGLAGATDQRVWIEDWQIARTAEGFRLQAEDEALRLDLTVQSQKPEVLQGQQGLSPKSDQPGNASYYYSRTRLATRGTLIWKSDTELADAPVPLQGSSWLDREWSTSALAPDQVGWDWFSLQLDDQRELMLYQLRRRDGTVDPVSSGTLVDATGRTTPLRSSDFRIVPLDTWTSPKTGVRYPSRWRLQVPAQQLDLTVTPRQADQELRLDFTYWEGAVSVQGKAGAQALNGQGYVELTGYGDRAERAPR